MATTQAYRLRVLLVTATCCVLGLIGGIMALSWLFAAPPKPPKPPQSCGASTVYRTIIDPKPDGNPYITVICRDGKVFFQDPNLGGN